MLSTAGMQTEREAAGGSPSVGTTQGCISSGCHEDLADRRYSHGPVTLGLCLSCHSYDEETTPYEAGEDHYFDTLDRDGRLCLRCHESQTTEAFVHYPLRRFKCLACHDPHGSDNMGMMLFPKMADNCFECHELDEEEDVTFVHAPTEAGACTTCHDPHGAPNAFQLLAPGPELCFRCHTDVRDSIAATRYAHRPVMEDCAKCHNPHGAGRASLLREDVPGLCLGCHTEMEEHIRTATTKHGALTEERSCLACHDPHVANLDRQLRDTPINLCLSCHDEPILAENRVLKDMKTYLEANPDHHGPIRTGDCGACHNPHGSNNTAILKKAFPKEFYAPFELERYSLCFSCHEQSLVTDPETETLTNFRNGLQNLHFTHVNREKKGRTCRSCHDIHASRHPKHLADAVPFGSWKLPIGFQKAVNGGSCSPGCHLPRSYDRLEAVDND